MESSTVTKQGYRVTDRRGQNDEGGGPIRLSDVAARAAPAPSAYAFKTLEEAFPDVDPEHVPMGSLALLQVRTPAKYTAGGIALPEDVRETEYWNTQIGKVRAIGPLAFKNRDTGEPWPEGPWFKVGDFVRVPKYGGDRFEVNVEGSEDKAIFVLFQEADIKALLTGDPLKYIAYITR